MSGSTQRTITNVVFREGDAFNSAWSIPIARAAVRIALRTHGSLLARRQV